MRVVPATFPGKQEHLTVWDLSSMRFLLQHRWAAITSQVPPSVADRRKSNARLGSLKSATPLVPLSQPGGTATIGIAGNGGREHVARPAVGNAQCRRNTITATLTVSARNKLALQASPLSRLIASHSATAILTRCQSAHD